MNKEREDDDDCNHDDNVKIPKLHVHLGGQTIMTERRAIMTKLLHIPIRPLEDIPHDAQRPNNAMKVQVKHNS